MWVHVYAGVCVCELFSNQSVSSAVPAQVRKVFHWFHGVIQGDPLTLAGIGRKSICLFGALSQTLQIRIVISNENVVDARFPSHVVFKTHNALIAPSTSQLVARVRIERVGCVTIFQISAANIERVTFCTLFGVWLLLRACCCIPAQLMMVLLLQLLSLTWPDATSVQKLVKVICFLHCRWCSLYFSCPSPCFASKLPTEICSASSWVICVSGCLLCCSSSPRVRLHVLVVGVMWILPVIGKV